MSLRRKAGAAQEAVEGSLALQTEDEPAGKELQQVPSLTGDDRGLLLRLYKNNEVETVSAEEAKAALADVRKRAEGWRNGVAASTALIFAVLTVKNEGIARFKNDSLTLIVLATLASVGCAMWSLKQMLRAANGPSWLDTRIADFRRPHDAERYLTRAGGAAHDLKVGQGFWIASVGGFTLTVLFTWLLPETGSNWLPEKVLEWLG